MQNLRRTDNPAAEGRVLVRMNQAALYSLDNGITNTSFKDGEFYAVPGWVAQAMIARGWARVAKGDEVPIGDPPEPPRPEPPRLEPADEPEPEPEVEPKDVAREQATAQAEAGPTFKMKLTTKGKRP